ncbi:MAG TPA: hypothetical protein VLH39_06655, partial [Magnetospirillaceae bacterium]|nr:hypothetical protein [Magnetospirillaceae bacterium]
MAGSRTEKCAGNEGGEDKPRRSARPAPASLAALWAALWAALTLASCATGVPEEPPRIELRIEEIAVEALDQHRVRFNFRTRVLNPGARPIAGFSVSWTLHIGEGPAAAGHKVYPVSLAAGGDRTEDFTQEIDLRDAKGGSAFRDGEAPWSLEVQAGRGDDALGAASAGGYIPLVREPRLSVRSIALVRH